MGGYITVYLEILILSFIVVAIVYVKTSRDFGSEREVVTFRWMLRIYMVMMVLDGFAQLQMFDVIHPPVTLVALLYGLYLALIAIMSVVWFAFAELQINAPFIRSRHFRVLAVIPGVVVAFMCIASVRTGWIMDYDEAGIYHRGNLYVVQTVVAYSYFLFTTIHALYTAANQRSYTRKRQMRRIVLFVVAPTIGGLLQLFVGTHPFVGPSVCISILAIFVSAQGELVNMDALTGLNNRKSLERYLRRTLPQISKENPLYLFMIDANRFKEINDIYGHPEGDRALNMIAQVLRIIADSNHGFIARFGGDEFVAVISADQITDPGLFQTQINTHLDDICKENRTAFRLSVSVGHTVCDKNVKKPDDLIKVADDMMYRAKTRETNRHFLEQW